MKDNKVLLIGAKDNEGWLIWSFPKGHQEIGETDIETAIRETREETGLEVKITDASPISVGHFVHGGTVYKKTSLFIAEPINDELKLQENEVEQIKWISIDQAEGFLTDHYSIAWKEFLNRSDKN